MAKKFKSLVAKMSKESQKEIKRRVKNELDEMDLKSLRQALKLTQEQLAKQLDIKQGSVSKIENQSDIFISTLRRFLEAMGGELQIIAHFQDHDVLIDQFQDIDALTT